MDIKKLLNNEGKIDPNKLYDAVTLAENWGALNAIAEAINDHIASLSQKTTITPSRLVAAGFSWDGRRKCFRKKEHAYFKETGTLRVDDCIEFHPGTMERLSVIWQCCTGESLNWQHNPAADLRKRLEAIGFEEERRGHYSLFYGSTFRVFLTEDLSDILHIGLGEYPEIGIKTIDELEEVMKRIVDKDDNTVNYSYCPDCKNRGRGGDTLGCGYCGRVSWH